ncbi:MAG: PHP domain-containing protein [Chloroflexales bacterium]|nr:PHP domain-containing protein [Chloroflexales bacterium]
MGTYVELHCHSAYSLLDGASTVAALVAQAAHLGMPALALTDHDALYGAVPFVAAAREVGVRPILGAELTLEDGCHLTLLVQDAAGWRNLCHLITIAQRDAPKGRAALPWQALEARGAGLICLTGCAQGPLVTALRAWDRQRAFRVARHLAALFPGRLYVELQHHLHPDDGALVEQLHRLAGYLRLPVVATNNVHYARRGGQRLQDTLHAIRRRMTLDALAAELRPNDEYYLKPYARLLPLFRLSPEALATTVEVAERCRYELQFGLQDLPVFPTPPGCDAAGYLAQLCAQALPARYGEVGGAARAQLRYELRVIAEARLANYLLIVWDLVRFARAQGIRCQGRGSAANSLVAYLLGIGPIDPLRHHLVFERFLSPERPALPDIDLDVDAARREEVIQYLYRRYGAEHVALACTFITFQARSALRDEAVLGLTAGDHAFVALRGWLTREGLASSRALRRGEDGSRVATAGVLVVRQSPPTAKGHIFLTLEDEHGLIDVILRPSIAARYAGHLRGQTLLRVVGMLQLAGGPPSVLAWHIEPLVVPGSAREEG